MLNEGVRNSFLNGLALVAVSLGLTPSTWSQTYVVPDDVPYYVHTHEDYQYILSRDHESHLPEIVYYNRFLRSRFQSEFSWRLDEKTSLVLASDRNQVANGFATVLPNILTAFYPGGAPMVDIFAAESWMRTLLIHESVHLYQLNAKQPLGSTVKRFLGNTPLILVPVPFFVHPNILLPTFLIEGHATFNEGRFGNGGRLYNPTYRASVLALMKAKKITYTSLVNAHINFPTPDIEKYVLGAYLQLDLAERHGVGTVNSFFWEHSRQFINPYFLNSTFRRVFKETYRESISAFLTRWSEMAERQSSSPEPALAKSFFFQPLHREGDTVYFLSSEELNAYPEINTFKSGRLETKRRNFKFGKLFRWDDGELYTAGDEPIGPTERKYGLFGENFSIRKEYLGLFVMDKQGPHVVAGDVSKSFHGLVVLKDGVSVGEAHSTALLSPDGGVYYTRQDGADRVILRDGQEVGRFEGRYAKPADFGPDGEFYFIGATPYGSGLFVWRAGQVPRRVSASDVIVDAKRVGPDQYLVCEATAEGFVYKMIHAPLADTAAAPAVHSYFYEKDAAANTFDSEVTDWPKTPVERYGEFRQIRFGYVNSPALGFDNRGDLIGSVGAVLADPLFYNTVTATVGRGSYGEWTTRLDYTYARYRPAITFNTSWERIAVLKNKEILGHSNETDVFLGFSYPLFRWGEWWGRFRSELGFEDRNRWQRSDRKMYSVETHLVFDRTLTFPRSYDPYRSINLWLTHDYDVDAESRRFEIHSYAARLRGSYDLGDQHIVSLWTEAGFSDQEGGLKIRESGPLPPDSTDLTKLSPGTLFVKEAQGVGASYKKVFNLGYYFAVFPVSLRRFAPYVSANYFHAREGSGSRDPRYDIRDYAAGLEGEFLLLYRLPVRLSAQRVAVEGYDADQFFWRFLVRAQTDF